MTLPDAAYARAGAASAGIAGNAGTGTVVLASLCGRSGGPERDRR